jgi:hypothetical protein
MKKALAGLTTVVLALAATTAVLVFQRVTGGGQPAAEAAGPPGSGYGGVHTRIDHEAGLRIGHEVAGFVLEESQSPGFGFSRS